MSGGPMTPEDFEKWKAFYGDIITTSFSQGAAYTNLVLGAGYAGAFVVWSNTRSDMSDRTAAWTAILLGVSLVAFVTFTVVQMIAMAVWQFRLASKLEGLQPVEYMTRYQAEAAQQQRESAWLRKLWAVTAIIAILAGTGAASILLYTFIAKLLDP